MLRLYMYLAASETKDRVAGTSIGPLLSGMAMGALFSAFWPFWVPLMANSGSWTPGMAKACQRRGGGIKREGWLLTLASLEYGFLSFCHSNKQKDKREQTDSTSINITSRSGSGFLERLYALPGACFSRDPSQQDGQL